MELDACIRGRRSVRTYENKAVPKELIDAVLDAGTWAPTGMNRQPCRFIVIENKEIIKYVSDETKKVVQEIMPNMAKQFEAKEDVVCYSAPVLIFVCVESDKMWGQVNIIDSVLAAENMFLKAYELGLGTCYMGFISYLNTRPDVLRKAGVPEGYELMVPMIIGYPKNKQTATAKRNKPNVLKWIK
jgi:nitroreductase